jgi:hypothetical protein
VRLRPAGHSVGQPTTEERGTIEEGVDGAVAGDLHARHSPAGLEGRDECFGQQLGRTAGLFRQLEADRTRQVAQRGVRRVGQWNALRLDAERGAGGAQDRFAESLFRVEQG